MLEFHSIFDTCTSPALSKFCIGGPDKYYMIQGNISWSEEILELQVGVRDAERDSTFRQYAASWLSEF